MLKRSQHLEWAAFRRGVEVLVQSLTTTIERSGEANYKTELDYVFYFNRFLLYMPVAVSYKITKCFSYKISKCWLWTWPPRAVFWLHSGDWNSSQARDREVVNTKRVRIQQLFGHKRIVFHKTHPHPSISMLSVLIKWVWSKKKPLYPL